MRQQPSVRRSLGIVTITKAAAFVLSLGTVVIVSRLLAPNEIGIFSISATLIGFAHVFREFGVGEYLVQTREVTRERRRAAFTVTLLISWSIAALLYAIREPAAAFYEEPGIREVMGYLAINFLVLPLATPLRAQLKREMQFEKIAAADLSNLLAAALVTVGAAWSGASYNSMAFGAIAGNIVGFCALAIISPRGALDWPTTHGLREVLHFGSRSSIASFASQLGVAAPDVIFGRTLGFADVAYYSRANGLLSLVLFNLLGVIHTVFFPLFSKGFREQQDLVELYTKSGTMALAVILPMLGMLSLLAAPLIEIMFGSQWVPSAPLGSMLCAFALITGPVMLAPYALTACGHVGLVMRCRLILGVLNIGILLSSAFLPLNTVVALLVVLSTAELLVFLHALRISLGFAPSRIWQGIRSSYVLLLLTLPAPAAAVVALRYAGLQSALLELGVCGMLGLCSWIAAAFWIRHPVRLEIGAAAAKIRHMLSSRYKWGR